MEDKKDVTLRLHARHNTLLIPQLHMLGDNISMRLVHRSLELLREMDKLDHQQPLPQNEYQGLQGRTSTTRVAQWCLLERMTSQYGCRSCVGFSQGRSGSTEDMTALFEKNRSTVGYSRNFHQVGLVM